MALVLRKALTPKNLALVKSLNGRTFMTGKRNKLYQVRPLMSRSMKKRRYSFSAVTRRFEERQRLVQSLRTIREVPTPTPITRQIRSLSLNRTRSSVNEARTFTSLSGRRSEPDLRHIRQPIRQIGDSPPCGAQCLPPPCNTPPRCIQYMTGFYYYPYGWWFCGPYHTAANCPCGPCAPEKLTCVPCSCMCPDGLSGAGAGMFAGGQQSAKNHIHSSACSHFQQMQSATMAQSQPMYKPAEQPKPNRPEQNYGHNIHSPLSNATASSFPACHAEGPQQKSPKSGVSKFFHTPASEDSSKPPFGKKPGMPPSMSSLCAPYCTLSKRVFPETDGKRRSARTTSLGKLDMIKHRERYSVFRKSEA